MTGIRLLLCSILGLCGLHCKLQTCMKRELLQRGGVGRMILCDNKIEVCGPESIEGIYEPRDGCYSAQEKQYLYHNMVVKCMIFIFQKLLLDLLHAWQKTKTKTSNNLSRVLNCMYHFALLLFASASASASCVLSYYLR